MNQLEVHHIVERCNNGSNDARNLLVLCTQCHDDTHAGSLAIGPLQQTSDGYERSVTRSESMQKPAQWTEDEMIIITSAVSRLKGRPPARILADLQEEGIRMTAAQLKKFRQAQL